MVLEAGHGALPSLAEHVAQQSIHGSWWSHPTSHDIYAAIQLVRSSSAVIATRLVDGKVTLIHRRLWPALVRVADDLSRVRLAALHEEHTASGAHRTTEIPFPTWVPSETMAKAQTLTAEEAWRQLPVCLRPEPRV
jgi:hypothetical protein